MNDIETLKKVLSLKKRDLYNNYFCWIYPFTNENIKGYYEKIDFNNKEVLTVTSSGDHILNAYFCGAKSIEAFDINPLSKHYSELKIASLKSLDLDEFIAFLYNKSTFKMPKYYLHKDIYNKIKQNLNETYRVFWDYVFDNYNIKEIYRSYLFSDDFLNIKRLEESNIYLESKNYYSLKNKLKDKKIVYHDCDIKNLINLKNKFDIILLSNIAAYSDLTSNEIEYLKDLKKIITYLKKDENSISVIGYLYSRLLYVYGALGIYDSREVRKYFTKSGYISFESSDYLSYPKSLRKILGNDKVIITK